MAGPALASEVEPVRPPGEPTVAEPEILRPLPRTLARFGREPSLSHGAVVEASILARLLGIRLLRLDAHIDMAPVDSDSIAVERYSTVPMTELTALPMAPSAVAGSTATLADAAELLQHASRTLGEVRRERVARR
jgi:hypothetical protein